MKITKAKLKQIIKEELNNLSEVEYDEHGPMYAQPVEDERTPDKAVVLVQGYAGLRIDQIRRRLQEMHAEIAADEGLGTLSYYLRNGVMNAFAKTLHAHNALPAPEQRQLPDPEEEKHSIDTQAIGE